MSNSQSAGPTPTPAATVRATEIATKVDAYLQRNERNYDPKLRLLGRPWVSPGYHSRVESGAWVHTTRDSLYYAAALLARGGTDDVARASAVIDAVVSLQDTDPVSKTYGIWSWMYEEPLSQMAPPDWNWADFCGAALLTILATASDRLPGDQVERIRASIADAAHSVFRRNVGPGYTNIAIMGGVVTAAAGELLGESWLLDYGRRRLESVVGHLLAQGDFNEYNSPTYTVIALEETERALFLCRDDAVRTHAETLRRHAWEVIADHFHPGTDQWAGPHSRAYSDFVLPTQAERIGRGVGREISVARRSDDERSILDVVPSVVPELPCPEELRDRFGPQREERVVERRFQVDESGRERRGYTWMGREATLSSVNADSTWTQRRGLIAYWPVAGSVPAVFRVRSLKDGRDFASTAILNAQSTRDALTAVVPALGLGDYHLSLDRTPDGAYRLERLVVRFALYAAGATIEETDHGFRLAAGDWCVYVRPLEAVHGGRRCEWSTGIDGSADTQVAYVEAALVDRAATFVPADSADTRVVAAVFLRGGGEAAPPIDAPRVTCAEGSVRYEHESLSLEVPTSPVSV